jgi:hypothetical protein
MAWSIFTQGGGKDVAVGWAEQLLRLIGAPVTPGNKQFVYDWEVSEGGGGIYNPLNQGPVPGQPQLTTSGSQYGGGAANFASWAAGLKGAADYLAMPDFRAIRTNLRANNPVAARSALIASPWAASHYGGGADFSNAPLPGGKPVLPAVGVGSGGTTATLTAAASNPACLLAMPTIDLKVTSVGGLCLLSKSEGRAFIGAALLAGGAAIMGLGVLVLVAYGLKSAGAGKVAGRALEVGGAAAAVLGAPEVGVPLAAGGAAVRRQGASGAATSAAVRSGKRQVAAKRTAARQQAGQQRKAASTPQGRHAKAGPNRPAQGRHAAPQPATA